MLPEGAKVLIIEDDRLVAKSVARLLRARNPVIVEDIEQARSLCEEFDFTLIVCDVRLRGQSGVDLLDHLREQGSPLAERFVLMTGASPPEGVGCPVLLKPFTTAEAKTVLAPVLERLD